ncbi:hypothetical protein BpHYR1_033071 [Brachionus plicatilis]|uniref:Uncharacterized protein n=1 Tax=Brachionus plicatilis TaxID=10195 RepID=A0A3M7RI73_BRAPC|nr:hypothetical protein BpHYR1_033071 [Brachionus plicatilis]
MKNILNFFYGTKKSIYSKGFTKKIYAHLILINKKVIIVRLSQDLPQVLGRFSYSNKSNSFLKTIWGNFGTSASGVCLNWKIKYRLRKPFVFALILSLADQT